MRPDCCCCYHQHDYDHDYDYHYDYHHHYCGAPCMRPSRERMYTVTSAATMRSAEPGSRQRWRKATASIVSS